MSAQFTYKMAREKMKQNKRKTKKHHGRSAALFGHENTYSLHLGNIFTCTTWIFQWERLIKFCTARGRHQYIPPTQYDNGNNYNIFVLSGEDIIRRIDRLLIFNNRVTHANFKSELTNSERTLQCFGIWKCSKLFKCRSF